MKRIVGLVLFGLVMVTLGCALLFKTVATPTFSPGSGEYTNSVTVTVSCDTPDAIIYINRSVNFYSNANLSLPPAVTVTDEWTEYTGPLTFRTNSTYVAVRIVLSAYAEKEGLQTSATNSATYILRK
ncbi:chitobiase/beta-hexosaminidase C-terminal domain-containing protein [Thermospira aquatica]|uniref:Chitobiase/beta-hexosaminidase C-terminal domain-containing protein n=1 Tax=Thermospira aquatica TaxID=2828656 RepID=A0AAX3BCJ5_9SPIR|nr:chitobiase/beta-hexosaminidase C-terminal domain-containing protein [Thermospira aquatica]URA09828.1 chitobiase/beta-hexosaminidase C-terminal domain-containing protein [Thermospira aquatica]